MKLSIVLTILSVFFISCVDITCKYLTETIHAMQIVWGYFFGITIFIFLFYFFKKISILNVLKAKRIKLQIVRSGFLYASIGALFIGLTYIPFAEATAISFSAPIFITILSIPILKENVTFSRWISSLIGLLGTVIVLSPGSEIWHWASIMPLFTALFFSIYHILTRFINRYDSTETTLLYTGIGGLIWSSMALPFFWSPLNISHYITFLCIGFLGSIAHLCLIKSYQLSDASLLAPYNYTKIIWAVIFGFIVFGDIPNLYTIIGTFIIISSGIYNFRRELNLNIKNTTP